MKGTLDRVPSLTHSWKLCWVRYLTGEDEKLDIRRIQENAGLKTNKMGCFNDPAWNVCGWCSGGVVGWLTNYLYPARWGLSPLTFVYPSTPSASSIFFGSPLPPIVLSRIIFWMTFMISHFLLGCTRVHYWVCLGFVCVWVGVDYKKMFHTYSARRLCLLTWN